MHSTFDVTASNFERYRPLPDGAAEAVRSAIYEVSGISAPARIIDIGAGTGRIGRAFVEAGDHYIGVDSSPAMLQQFRSASPRAMLLRTEGTALPFIQGSFDVVLMMRVLSGTDDWMSLLKEALRVLERGGSLALGHVAGPDTGLDKRMKRRLRSILAEAHTHNPDAARRDAMAWLASAAQSHGERKAFCWQITTSPRDFLERHGTGARFAALPEALRETALATLRDWAESEFGSLDASICESREFELSLYTF